MEIPENPRIAIVGGGSRATAQMEMLMIAEGYFGFCWKRMSISIGLCVISRPSTLLKS